MASSSGPERRERRLLLLVPEDNVYCACVDIPAGTQIEIDGENIVVSEDVPVGFKIARHDLATGDKVYKYGAPIGSMSQPARRGAIVHTHNLRSDYLPTYTLTDENRFVKGAE